MQPPVAVALAAVFLGERLTRAKGLALALGVAGIVLISTPALDGAGDTDLSGPMLTGQSSRPGRTRRRRSGPSRSFELRGERSRLRP